MSTVQHPAFPSDTQAVDDPAPWVEQGWILLDEAVTDVPADDVAPDVVDDVPGDTADVAEPVDSAPKPGPRNKR